MQNVDINKEVQRAMVSPTQGQGIVNLLASELKARDAKAKQQIGSLMAEQPDPNSIMAQNEKEVENSVRQEIGQKMQARVMQERQAQARQRQALAGIAGQRAPNMRMADGGIVGYAEGGRLLFDDMGKSSDNPQFNIMSRMLSNRPTMGPPDPRTKRFQRETDYLERLRRKSGERTFPEALLDMIRETGRYNQRVTDPDTGEEYFIPGYTRYEGIMGDRRARQAFMRNNPELLNRIKAREEATARLQEAEGYATGGMPEVGAQSKGPIPSMTPEQLEYVRKMGELRKSINNPANTPEQKQRALQELQNYQREVPAGIQEAVDIMMRGPANMAEGGIIGFKEGDYVGGITGPMGIFAPGINKGIGFADFLARKGVESLAGLSADAVNRLRQEYEAMQAREMDRPRGDSVSESQMENLGGVLRGAGNVLTEGIASLAPEPQGRNRTELADMGGAPGAGGAPQARRGPSAADLADAQSEMDILNAAQRRQDEAERAAREPQPYVLSDLAKGAGLESFFSGIPSFEEMYPPNPEDASLAYKVGSATRALGTPFKVLSGFLQPKDEDQLTFSDVGPIASEFTAGLTGAEMPTQQTDEEVAQEIIDTGVTPEQYREATGPATPTAPAIGRGAIDAASTLAREVETTPSGAEGAARAASVITGRDGEAAAVDLASTVAKNPTPENTSRFESEIQRLMERRESPMRALSSFLTSFSQARGGSLGQNIGIASTALRAADDALDKQIVALEQLRRADQISERDFGLKERQLQAQKGLLDAQAKYYGNYKDMQVEIANIRAQQGEDVANRRLYQSILDITETLLPNYRMAAMNSLGSDDPSSQEVLTETNRLMQEAIRTKFREAQNYFKLPETSGASPNSAVQEGATATNAQGDKIVFTNGAWAPM